MTDPRPQNLPPPGASSLHDFKPLLPAESLILRAAALGEIAKIGYRRPRAPDAEARVRASFLAFLARGGSAAAPVAGRHLQVMGACVTGRLDLAGATLPMSLWLYRCTFVAAPLLDGACVRGSLSFADSALPALQAEGCRVDGELALSAGCSIDGEVRLARSSVAGDLNCERLQLGGGSPPARSLRRMFEADGMRIGGDVNLHGGVEAVGELRFVGAQIAGDLCVSAAHLTADIDAAGTRGVALNLDRVRIGGSVRLDAGFSAAGTVRMRQANIGGDLDCSGAAFDTIGDASWGECGSSLRLDRARIGGALILRGLQEPLQGASLADASVGTLTDDAGSWGQDHVLDGFAYTRFGAGAPSDAPARIDWLVRQAAAHVDADFRPDPWRRAIGALRHMGHSVSASALAIGRARHLRRIGRVGAGTPPALRWLTRLSHDLWGLCAGYGHRPWRLLVAGTLLWLVCGGAYWAAADRGGFTAATWAVNDPRFATCGTDCARLPAGVPAFQPVVYSLDALLPLADLRQERHWAPARHALMPEAEPWVGVPLLQLLIWFEAACGWALALMALASLLGRRDRGHQH